jgi:DNA-binding transcriptional LysR family regulator
MELRHLRYFVTVAEELHFTRAAKKLRIAQQALSAQIRNLEVELGFDLFVRNPKGVALTPAGQELLNGARDTLATAAASVEAARDVAARDTNLPRLGFCSYAMKLGLGDAINAFRSAWPDVRLALNDFRDPSNCSGWTAVNWMWLFAANSFPIAHSPESKR